ncbi:MAG: hypothetical protein KatS3mg111_2698 [Pirellulaceae bacterium]|nr:MAG: hypothetical protein KatS3mg111_2698 [Pirellulaceae bacterium]
MRHAKAFLPWLLLAIGTILVAAPVIESLWTTYLPAYRVKIETTGQRQELHDEYSPYQKIELRITNNNPYPILVAGSSYC